MSNEICFSHSNMALNVGQKFSVPPREVRYIHKYYYSDINKHLHQVINIPPGTL